MYDVLFCFVFIRKFAKDIIFCIDRKEFFSLRKAALNFIFVNKVCEKRTHFIYCVTSVIKKSFIFKVLDPSVTVTLFRVTKC